MCFDDVVVCRFLSLSMALPTENDARCMSECCHDGDIDKSVWLAVPPRRRMTPIARTYQIVDDVVAVCDLNVNRL